MASESANSARLNERICATWLLVEPGHDVMVDQALVEMTSLRCNQESRSCRLGSRSLDPLGRSDSHRWESWHLHNRIGHARLSWQLLRQSKRLITHSPGEGVFAVVNPQDCPDASLRKV